MEVVREDGGRVYSVGYSRTRTSKHMDHNRKERKVGEKKRLLAEMYCLTRINYLFQSIYNSVSVTKL